MSLISIGKLSRLLEIPTATIYKYVCQRRIPFVKIHGHLRFDVGQIEAWIARSTQAELSRGKAASLPELNDQETVTPGRSDTAAGRMEGRKDAFSTLTAEDDQ